MTQKRTAVRVPAGTSAAEALKRAEAASDFERMPGARKRRRKGAAGKLEDAAEAPTDTDTDLQESMEELFEQDSLHDLIADEGELEDAVLDAKEANHQVYLDAIADGIKASEHKNGRVVELNARGHFVRELAPAPRDEETGQFLRGVEGTPGSPEWFQATTSGELVDRIKDRIEALGASLFQKTGGLSPARRGAMTRAFIADRARRAQEDDSWKLPRTTTQALSEWADSEQA